MFVVSVDLPTPPLPEQTAITRVRASSESSPRGSTPPRSFVVSTLRSSGVITSKWSCTVSTPSSPPTCWRT